MHNENFEALPTTKCGMHKSIKLNYFEILCCLDKEIGLVCWQLVHDMHAMEIFGIQPTCELSLFSMKLSELVGYFYYL